MKIVSRSQIEHWIAQKTETIKDTTVLHHFSNLALINTSENIRNSNKTTDQKNIQVGENPSAKLLWLAWFARAHRLIRSRNLPIICVRTRWMVSGPTI